MEDFETFLAANSFEQPILSQVPAIKETLTFLSIANAGMTLNEVYQLAATFIQNTLECGNPVKASEIVAAMEKFTEAVRKDSQFKESVRDEVEKEHGLLTTASGATIECCEVNIKFDFSQDEEWCRLKCVANEANAALKERETYLKTIKQGAWIVDKATGEIVAKGPIRTSDSSYRITLAK